MNMARLQAMVALVAALGLHMAAFAMRPGEPGAVSAGDGGADLVSIQPADAAIADLVARWDRPPETASTPFAAMTVPAMPNPALTAPAAITAPTLPLPTAPAAPSLPEPPPAAATALPAPPLPVPEPRPAPPVAALTPAPPEQPPPARFEPVDTPSDARPMPRPQRSAAPARPAQQAAGGGQRGQAGDAGRAEAATGAKARQSSLLAEWGATIRARVERNKRFPPDAPTGAGKVTVRLSVGRDGSLRDASVAATSGSPAFDQAALSAVRRAARFPAAPEGLDGTQHSFTLTMRFSR